MDFIDENLSRYCEDHTSGEDTLLKKISRTTQAKVLLPRMISGHFQGKFLELISKMIRPKQILELGTYTGYSAICLARGLAKGGTLTTIDINDELETMVQGFFEESGMSSQIDYHLGNALEIIPELDGPFDLVFIDADKLNYSNYFDMLIDKIPTGGFILADNVLWSGKVLSQEVNSSDKDTLALIEFNQKIQDDTRVENALLPIRDGLMMLRKR
ncbi:O-methyltransferase [Algoriphagus sediminis]|uniref:O-methyltransferase n=1 Tax=Algoriphagus sediminis TaxID=3057113 RepID=A0ABT7YG46_9BACT|nr:O-methyltransferase [Algoriphagus sediminis]MDN3205495.1 O-methyltransferase [Algoriphagus sediminis]